LGEISAEALPEVVEGSFAAFWAQFVGRDGVEMRTEGGVTLFTTGLPDHNLNRVLQARLDARTVDAAIDRAIAHFGGRGVPFSWVVGPASTPDDLPRRLIERGLAEVDRAPGMIGDLEGLPEVTLPAGLVVEAVADLEAHEQWMRCWTVGFPDWAVANWDQLLAGAGFGATRTLRRFLGLLDGEPVATSALSLGAGVARVDCVGTAEAARGRGIGTAMALTPLIEARRLGYRFAVLVATPMGFRLYARLGFRECATFEFYWWSVPRAA
jgi:ribosomal protein S18 acetylase RimI-like enzyme